MNHALMLNGFIILAVLIGMFISSSPLPMMALFMLREMPYGLIAGLQEEEDDPGYGGGDKPVGFHDSD